MCRQVLQIAECGHENGTEATECEKPTSECGGIFLRPVLEDIKGLCAVSILILPASTLLIYF